MPFKTIDLTVLENFAPFDGDGRRKISPSALYEQARPAVKSVSMTRGVARLLIENFMKTGVSNHKADGADLWVIETWCYVQDIEIKITKHPFGGWQIRQLEQEVEEPEEAPLESFDLNGFDSWGDQLHVGY